MIKAVFSGLLATGALAAVGGLALSGATTAITQPAVVVVDGPDEVTASEGLLGDFLDPGTPEADATGCTTTVDSAGSVAPVPGERRCGPASHVTLADRVYFGAYWQILDQTPATAAITLGGGYANVRVERTGEGDFFAGIVERIDASGAVTDVILAFAGAHGLDAVQGESILVGAPLDESARATSLYDGLLENPRYANARVHVTGHSLGAGYTQFVLAYALASHGESATDRRADFLGFGAPNWAAAAARHFGIDAREVARRMVDFTTANDPVLINGVERIGVNNSLPAFHGLTAANAALNVVAAHWPTTYASALGLPDWLSPSARAAATAAVSAHFNTGDSIDPNYGPAGTLPVTVDGSGGREWLQGFGGGDRLLGGGGADVLTGGRGGDLFVYRARTDAGGASAADWITDFSQAEGDRVDLSGLASLLDGRLRFVGTAPFDGDRSVRYAHAGGDTLILIDLDRDRSADLTIRLSGRLALRAADFVF